MIGVGAGAERDDVGVFEEEQLIGDLPAPPPLDQGLLPCERLGVGDSAEMVYFQFPHFQIKIKTAPGAKSAKGARYARVRVYPPCRTARSFDL
jgi:hypothetical protein